MGDSVIGRLVPLAFVIVAGCSNRVADMTCGNVISEAVRISKGEIVDVNNRTQTSKDDRRIVCHGISLTNDGRELPTRFQAFTGDDGAILVKFDTDEYEAKEAEQARREQQRYWAQTQADVDRTVDQAMSEGRAEAASMAPQ